jgi:hypothetical protein
MLSRLFKPSTTSTNKLAATGYLTDMDAPLLQLDGKHAFTLRHAFEGVQIFGGTGSGKTSGSGRALAHAYLKAGFGGLILCAKIDEADNWTRYALECGREKSLLRFDYEGGARFNFLEYDMLTSKTTDNAVHTLMNILRAGAGQAVSNGESNRFWEDSVKQLISNSLDLLFAAYGKVRLPDVGELVLSTPQNIEEGASDHWNQTSFFAHTVKKATYAPVRPLPPADMRSIQHYFLKWVRMEHKTRSNIEATLSTTLAGFEKGAMRELFTTTTNIVPELTHEGALIVVDLPKHTWGDAGITAQHILKYAWQRAAQRRKPDTQQRPVFLWADESQYFISDADAEFQSTARSYRAATVYMTQSLNAYKHAIGGVNAENTVMALVGNLRTQIFHQSGNPDTCNYAAKLVGKGLHWRENVSEGSSEGFSHGESYSGTEGASTSQGTTYSNSRSSSGGQGWLGLNGQQASWNESDSGGTSNSGGWHRSTTEGMNSSISQNRTQNRGASQQKDYLLEPDYFRTELRTGGKPNGGIVDGVIIAPNLPKYLRVQFKQGG